MCGEERERERRQARERQDSDNVKKECVHVCVCVCERTSKRERNAEKIGREWRTRSQICVAARVKGNGDPCGTH